MKQSVPYIFPIRQQALFIINLLDRIEELEKAPAPVVAPDPVVKKQSKRRNHICGLVGRYAGECEDCNALK